MEITSEIRKANVERLLKMRNPDIRNLVPREPPFVKISRMSRKSREPKSKTIRESSSLDELKQRVLAEISKVG